MKQLQKFGLTSVHYIQQVSQRDFFFFIQVEFYQDVGSYMPAQILCQSPPFFLFNISHPFSYFQLKIRRQEVGNQNPRIRRDLKGHTANPPEKMQNLLILNQGQERFLYSKCSSIAQYNMIFLQQVPILPCGSLRRVNHC